MNIENEKDLQVWLELYKAVLAEGTSAECADLADWAFVEYKKRAKALEEAKEKEEVNKQDDEGWIEWHGSDAEGIDHPFGGRDYVTVMLRNGETNTRVADSFRWVHYNGPYDIVKARKSRPL